MKLVSQYGPNALNTHDFIGWLNKDKAGSTTFSVLLSRSETLKNYYILLSQPMTKEMFVKPVKPKEEDYYYLGISEGLLE